MNYTEANEFLKYLRELFPHWNWTVSEDKTNPQERVWLRKLYPFNINVAYEAIDNVFAHGKADYQRQLLPAFITEANRVSNKYSTNKASQDTKPEPLLLYTLTDESDTNWKLKIYHPTKMPNDKEALLKEAMKIKANAEAMYAKKLRLEVEWEI